MNKEYRESSFYRAIHHQAKSVGIENIFHQIKDRSGKKLSARTFSNKLNPSQEAHQLTVQELMLMLEVLQEDEKHVYILEEMLRVFGMKCKRHNSEESYDITYRNVLHAWMDWDKERGDVQQEIRDALVDGKVSANELEEIKKEMDQDISAMTNLRDMLEFACSQNLTIK
ncbi:MULTISPECIES: phage regulatory CII family protein [Photobacterium]|uniref:Uncharacterized protein n=1 Tax=Photobacterium ganghwense TaxID=320778 RepID=A0A0J1GXF2_9GAMM|nr:MULTISPECIES: phage regulatory CII family protein [Photobacterium]KLV04343.1 hypothetical protein ABT57_24205 [Photobacterium ganghwense]MBV1840885.1 phage regulatory CII family protein [Photobacterium ganghwense]PSU08027.1 hypothetical protein C9I92_10820 [Photobacterium ganghwense]QSV14835.1 phage regulatory CII family protein [Photobacterium ganghwense]